MKKEYKQANELVEKYKKPILKKIHQLINERNWQKAIDITNDLKLHDERMHIYDKMLEIYGETPTYAGEDAESIGYLAKAKKYSESVGESSRTGRIEDMVSKDESSFKMTNKIINQYTPDSIEEAKGKWKIHYYFKSDDQQERNAAISDLTEFLPAEVLVGDPENYPILPN
jgi:uncharacterized beta-barrel protein YwiB (DUF1934 family)